MAAQYSITTQGELALVAATVKTAVAVVGATQTKAKIIEWGISFDGVSTTAEPVQVRLIRSTVDGTATTVTIKPFDPDNPTANCVGKGIYTVEPTKEAQPVASYEVHPQSGIVIQYPLGREPVLDNATGSIIGIDATAPANVNCLAYIVWEE